MNILIFDDDSLWQNILEQRLSKKYQVKVVDHPKLVLNLIKSSHYDFAIIDLYFEGSPHFGFQVVEKLSKKGIKVILLSGSEDTNEIKKAYKLGAIGYVKKCQKFQYTLDALNNIVNECTLINQLHEARITKNQKVFCKLKKVITQHVNFHSNLLIQGPSGTGKTRLAKIIHSLCHKNKPFLHLNLAELSENLIESELFGHNKGSFTGALHEKQGLLKQAHGGVLFLDEIGVCSPSIQTKLLRVLEEKKYRPLGGHQEFESDFILIAATCDNLDEKIKDGTFRKDLYYRLKGTDFLFPPLKDRVEDIPQIINDILNLYPKKIAFDDRAWSALLEYSWPGNVRELKSCIQELISNSSAIIETSDLPFLNLKTPTRSQNAELYEQSKKVGLKSALEQIEKEIISLAREEFDGKVNLICQNLKLSKTKFYKHSS